MSYTVINFQTKKALVAALANGTPVALAKNFIKPDVEDGIDYVVGPHTPEVLRWSARVIMKNGFVQRIFD